MVAVGVGVTREKNLSHPAKRKTTENIVAGELSENRKVNWWPGHIAGYGFLRHYVLFPPKGKVSQSTA